MIEIGSIVLLHKWNSTIPSYKRLSDGVVRCICDDVCESGKMITVDTKCGNTITLDMGWLKLKQYDELLTDIFSM